MSKKFNDNILKALEASHEAVKICKQAMIDANDEPAIYLNTEIQKKFRPLLEKFYYDDTKFDSYLEQLGISYPTVKSN